MKKMSFLIALLLLAGPAFAASKFAADVPENATTPDVVQTNQLGGNRI